MNSFVYIGPYLQLLEKKRSFDLFQFIEDGGEKLSVIPSECFDINYTLLISNQGKLGTLIGCGYGGKVIESSKIDVEAEMTKFKNKFQNEIKILEQNFEKAILKHGIIYYYH